MRNVRLILILLLLSVGLALLLAPTSKCGCPPAAPATGPASEAVSQVVEQTGQLEASEQAALHARVSGYVKDWLIDVGDMVKKGQLLAELSVPELDRELLQKKAAVEMARSSVIHAERALDAASARSTLAEAAAGQSEAARVRAEARLERWKSEYRRARGLQRTGDVAAAEMEAVVEKYQTAKAAVAEGKAALRVARAEQRARRADLAQAEAGVQVSLAKQRVAEAERDRAAEMVALARITAPFDGTVTRRDVARGQLVQPPPAGTTTAALFTVVRTNRVRVLVDVPESAAVHIRRDTKASVRVKALGQLELVGRVTRTTWALDRRTRTLRAQVELDNKEGLLRPGMVVAVRLQVERTATLVAGGR
jgi:multidrug efflux pump subunit AcrA (membrane-fusion protein)